MDCGHMFEALYGDDALYNIESFRKALTKVEDPMLLGSDIFSRWRYLTHWGYNESLTDEESRAWFIAAFRRMMEIV